MNTYQYTEKITIRSLIVFFLLAFGITWGLSVIATKDLLPFAIPALFRNISAFCCITDPPCQPLSWLG